MCAAEQKLLMTHGQRGAIVRTYDGVALGEDVRLYQEQANFSRQPGKANQEMATKFFSMSKFRH